MMTKIEKRLLGLTEKHIHIVIVIAAIIIGTLMRVQGYEFISVDMRLYLLPWFSEIKEKGLAEPVGNYNILYQEIIFMLTKLKIPAVVSYKIFSCLFDFLLAGSAGVIVFLEKRCGYEKNREMIAISFCLVYCSLPVVLNSAFWVQCDSVYTFLCVVALLFLYYEHSILAILFLGIAFSFKLQAIFVLPFFIFVWFRQKSFSMRWFLLIPVVMIVLAIPGLVAGRNIFELFYAYRDQIEISQKIYYNYPGLPVLLSPESITEEFKMIRNLFCLLTVAVEGIGLCFLCKEGEKFTDFKSFWGTAMWTIYTAVLFLPCMHERYAYILEIMALILAFIDVKTGLCMTFITQLITLSTYGFFLFSYRSIPLVVLCIINLITYFFFSIWSFKIFPVCQDRYQ